MTLLQQQRASLQSSPLIFTSQLPRGRRPAGRHVRHVRASAPEQQPEEEQPLTQAQLKAQLNRLFYNADAELPGEPSGEELSEEPAPAAGPALPGRIQDLPLWRVQWASLPGYQEVYHVHVPHYTDMFSRLLAQPRPWHFGHLYLPEGSPNLGSPEYEMAPGSKAPLVGTLMEVLQAVRFPDGRLLVLAVGVGRFKVVASRQAVPHSRADVVLLPDWEEVQQQQALAMDALEGGAGEDMSVSAAMQVSLVAAEQAAAAAAQDGSALQEWWPYEISSVAAQAATTHRQGQRQGGAQGQQLLGDDVINGSNESEARAFGKLLVGIGNQPVAPLPTCGPGSAEAEGEWGSDSEDEAEEEAGEGEGEQPEGVDRAAAAATEAGAAEGQQRRAAVSAECAANVAAAEQAAHAAAAAVIQALGGSQGGQAGGEGPSAPGSPQQLSQGLGFGSWTSTAADAALTPGLSLAHASSGSLLGVNSTAERGIPSLPVAGPAEEEEEGGQEGEGGSSMGGDKYLGTSRSVALRLEELAWRELDAVCHLAARIRGQGVPLGDGLAQLRPPGSAAPPEAEEEAPAARDGLGSLHPSYPALRRAQRLSYALASVLGDISGSEGRQALLEASSISARLRLVLAGLRKHRSVLAAVVAVQDCSGSEEQ